MILKNPSVVDVKLVAEENSYLVKILFDDGDSLEVSGVNENGTGGMEIHLINGYYIVFCDELDRRPVGREIRMQIYSTIVGEQLETVTDIIRNYHKIRQYVNNLPDLSGYTNDNDKNISEVIDRLLYVEKLFLNTVFFVKGKGYYLFKIPGTLLLNWSNRVVR